MKKLYFVTGLLCAILCLGCGAKQQAGGAAKSVMDGKEKGSLPLADGTATLSLFLGGLDNFVTSYEYEDNDITRKIVDETGVKLEFVTATRADAAQKRNVLLSSGEYPDIFIGGGAPRDFMTYYAATGQFIALDDYHLLEYPRIKAFFERYPQVYDMIRWGDGKIHALPGVNECEHCTDDSARPFIYMPWIRNNNRKVPTNLAEFTDFLRFVRDNDVNGNGNKNDEVPFMFYVSTTTGQFQRHAISIFAKMYMPFLNTGYYFGLAKENGKIVEQYKDPRFREALKTMAALYKERLILPESFTMNQEQAISLVESKEPTVASIVTNHLSGVTYGTGERRVDYNLAPVMAGPTGLRYGSNREPWSIVNMGMFVTDKCEDPELAVAWYDYMLRMDALLGVYIGDKGVAWDDPDPGALGLNGQPALYKYLITWRSPDHKVNMGWNQIANFPQSLEFRLGEQALDFDVVRRWMETGDPSLRQRILTNASYFETHNYLSLEYRKPHWLPDDIFVPVVNLDDADNAKMADISTPLNTYIDEATAAFVTGARDVSSDAAWNAYLAELDRMGSAERIALLQKYIK